MAKKTDLLASDFRNFVFAVWDHLRLPEPTPIQYDIALYLQNGPRRRGVEAFRGVGKSWLTAAYVCWLLYKDPQHKILVVSASKARADNFSTFVLDLINSAPFLRKLRPKDGQRQSKVAFDVGEALPDQSPSVMSLGITSQLAGTRANTIIADDIEVPNNSITKALREQLLERVKEFDAILKPNGEIIYLGTPQTEESCYNVLQTRGYVFRVWPALYPTPKEREKYGPILAPRIATVLDKDPDLAGKPTDPRRFSKDDLDERKLSYGRQGFALQFMLDTSLSDADRFPLKLADLIVYPIDHTRTHTDFMWAGDTSTILNLTAIGMQGDCYHRPGWVSEKTADFESTIMFIDPSGRGADETAYAIVRGLHGRLFLVAAGGYREGHSDATLDALCSLAKAYKVNHILCEPNQGGGMFTSIMKSALERNKYLCLVEDAKWSQTQKEARIIDTLEPVLSQHKLVIDPKVIERDLESIEKYGDTSKYNYSLFYQLTRITRQRGALAHDDRVDALAGAVAFFTEQMAKDSGKAAETHLEELWEQEIERMRDHLVGPISERY